MSEKKTNRDIMKIGGSIAGLIGLAVILVAVNIVLSNVSLRSDMTDENLYTLSKGSRNYVKNLDSKVTLKLFFSSSNAAVPPQIKAYAKQVEDLLHEYVVASKGKVILEKYDPKPDSDAEEWAEKYGLQGQSIGMMIGGPQLYFGLVASSGGIDGAIPALDPRTQQLLEYNVTRLIHRVLNPDKPTIGVMSSLSVMGTQAPQYSMPGQPRPQQEPPWMVFGELRQDYNVKTVDVDATTIDSDIKALVLVHPQGLADKTLFAIDQFVLGGGRLIVYLDPFCTMNITSAPSPYGRPNASSDIPKLLSAWGVTYDSKKVLADPKALSRVRSSDNKVDESMVFLSLRGDAIDKKDVTTSQLETIMMPFAGSFKVKESKDINVTPLITSSAAAGMVSTMSAQMSGSAVRRELKSGNLPLDLAVRMTGKFKTAFPDGAPKADDKSDAAADKKVSDKDKKVEADNSLKEGNSSIVLVADVDCLYDRYCVQEFNMFGAKGYRPLNDNIHFFDNTLEQMAGSTDLIGVRSRGKFDRPFSVVLDLESKAQDKWQEQENALMSKLQTAQQELARMQRQKDQGQQVFVSAEQKAAIAKFRAEEIKTKQELKSVRKNLRQDIDRLGLKVKVINIALMPLLVCIAGIGYGLYRRRKM